MINKLQLPISEADIKQYWKYTDKIYVSCICLAYNHESYIKDAIDSMLAQQTEYQFEIVIHDDCSTDTTREILIEYKKSYPTIIKLILQKENQYSKHPRIIPLTVPYLDGEFVTVCEGDDFWIDEKKLQSQITALKSNENINICFTSANTLTSDGVVNIIAKHALVDKIFTLEDVITGGGGFMPTASIMLKKNILNDLPEWYYSAPVGDYFLQIFASMFSGALFISQTTSVYRINSVGSWSAKRNSMSEDDLFREGIVYENALNQLINNHVPKDIVFKEISNRYLDLTMIAIRNDYQKTAIKLIEKSWQMCENNNKKQALIYKLRRFNFALKIIIGLNKMIKNTYQFYRQLVSSK